VGFLRKIKKVVKKVAKVAIKTSPIWSSFIPGGGFAMTLLKSGLKVGGAMGNASPSAKNRFPLPNAFMQPSATTARAIQIHQVSPRVSAGPYSSRYGMQLRHQERLSARTRLRALRGRRPMRRVI